MREALMVVAVGGRGVGKTYTTVNSYIIPYLKGDLAKRVKPRKFLILDVNDEFVQFKAIALKDIVKFSMSNVIECRRVRPFKPNGLPMSLDDIKDALRHILKNYYEGGLLIEDISNYISDSMPGDFIGSLCVLRHKSVDLFIHYQGINKVKHPKILMNMNILRYHYTSDEVARDKNGFQNHYTILQLAENIVRKKYSDGDERFFLLVDLRKGKISGKFSEADFLESVNDYISDNQNTTIKALLRRCDRDGNKIYTYNQALVKIENDYMKQFYGN